MSLSVSTFALPGCGAAPHQLARVARVWPSIVQQAIDVVLHLYLLAMLHVIVNCVFGRGDQVQHCLRIVLHELNEIIPLLHPVGFISFLFDIIALLYLLADGLLRWIHLV